MDFGFEADYMGVRYPAAVGPENNDVTLFTTQSPGVHLGFEPCQGYWRKRLTRADLDALALIRTFGYFRGERCFVLEQTGDQMHIAYAGHDAYHAEHLGYWMVDRGVYEAVVPAAEVTETWIERVDLPVGLAAAAPIQPVPSAFGDAPAVDAPAATEQAALPHPADGGATVGMSAGATGGATLGTIGGPAGAIGETTGGVPAGATGGAEAGAAAGIETAGAPAPGQPDSLTLERGTLIDRLGPEKGRLVFAEGTPFEQRALPETHREYPCRVYRVTAPAGLAVLGGPVAPWFGQPGGGVMYELPRTIEELVDLRALERVEETS
jgi:hypothetical protein